MGEWRVRARDGGVEGEGEGVEGEVWGVEEEGEG